MVSDFTVCPAVVPPGLWHRTGRHVALSVPVAISLFRLERKGGTHTLADLTSKCVASGFCGCSLRKNRGVPYPLCSVGRRSKMWGWKCSWRVDKRERERERGKGGGTCETEQVSLPRRQVYVNHRAVQFQTYLSSGGSHRRISSNRRFVTNYESVLFSADLTRKVSRPNANSQRCPPLSWHI